MTSALMYNSGLAMIPRDHMATAKGIASVSGLIDIIPIVENSESVPSGASCYAISNGLEESTTIDDEYFPAVY